MGVAELDAGLPDGAVVTLEDWLLASGDTAEILVDVVLPDGQTDRFAVLHRANPISDSSVNYMSSM